jgi:hypothetical protein
MFELRGHLCAFTVANSARMVGAARLIKHSGSAAAWCQRSAYYWGVALQFQQNGHRTSLRDGWFCGMPPKVA